MPRLSDFMGGSIPPENNNFSGPLCKDPACFRGGPHFPREWGCRWNDHAIINKDGTVTIFKDEHDRPLRDPVTIPYRGGNPAIDPSWY